MATTVALDLVRSKLVRVQERLVLVIAAKKMAVHDDEIVEKA